jgi:hypothetical protein
MLPTRLLIAQTSNTSSAQDIISSAHSGDAAALLQALLLEDEDEENGQESRPCLPWALHAWRVGGWGFVCL